MAQAVSAYQQRLGLPVTGQVDDQTLALLRRPRCGVPDIQKEGAAKFPRRAGDG